MRRPLGVSLISFFYFFGAIILLFTSVFYDVNADAIGIAERFGVPNAPEQLVRVLVAGLSLVMVYGYRNLKKWGFWLMIIYSILFGMLSLTLATTDNQQPFIGNMIWSIIVFTYSIYVKDAYFKQNIQ